MNEEILRAIREKGLLVEKEVFDLLNSINDISLAKGFLEQLERLAGQKIITKSVLGKNVQYVKEVMSKLPGEDKSVVEKVFVNLGISFEVRKESVVIDSPVKQTEKKTIMDSNLFQIFYADTKPYKKLEVSDFTGNFRSRYQQIQRILMTRPELNNLVAINKISGERQNLSIIAIVTEKRVTKNKNLIIRFEDMTGEVNALIKVDKEELFKKANELMLDDIVAVKASGSREMLFVHDIFFPDAILTEKTRFNEDISVAFISDLHCGSDRHLSQSLGKFINWINSEEPSAQKIRYLFIVGDNVDGVGIFPGQENVLALKSMNEQYELLASYLRKIPKRITMFMCPGQHDATRVAEPQPIIDKKYAPQLYDIDNLILVTNPTLIKLMEKDKEFKVLMYHGASIHNFINEIPELREIKAHKTPAKAVRHILKRRHLAPLHSAMVYIPNEDKDPLVIEQVPDVLCTGEVHRLDIETYNGILIITGSCWQAQTPFEEKVGNIPDPAKVPVLNLKTRELKIFDFGVEEEINKDYSKK